MALKLLFVERLDESDAFVFEHAAPAGEIAVSGAFAFWGEDPAALAGKRRQAFRSGFLGIGSFGRSTLATVAEVTPAARAAAIESLADHLLAQYGAPSPDAARAAAEDELAFAESLADLPVGTTVAVARAVEDGEIRERFRTLHRSEPKPDFSRGLFNAIVAVPDDAPDADTAAPDATVDLAALAARPEWS
ncbi:DUF6505 family protein [Mongoliimonas terrestris]|uniref:DUF6505 family protein n=1 Tax=Mongoliimonas terrestris TaxID=1709001 RepID=UPI0009495489|nr:DUF6505 family protein [Mongoliimonas terrestris]